jgi:hypothetical protein
MNLVDLSEIQRNVLLGSILGDGEITKIYKNSRRKNNSYREHFSLKQLEYRVWKRNFMPDCYILILNQTPFSQSPFPCLHHYILSSIIKMEQKFFLPSF